MTLEYKYSLSTEFTNGMNIEKLSDEIKDNVTIVKTLDFFARNFLVTFLAVSSDSLDPTLLTIATLFSFKQSFCFPFT